MPSQQLIVNINTANLFIGDGYSSLPKERMLAEKIERAIKQHTRNGWSVERIDSNDDGAAILFTRLVEFSDEAQV